MVKVGVILMIGFQFVWRVLEVENEHLMVTA
jgi:hypothetical protein